MYASSDGVQCGPNVSPWALKHDVAIEDITNREAH